MSDGYDTQFSGSLHVEVCAKYGWQLSLLLIADLGGSVGLVA